MWPMDTAQDPQPRVQGGPWLILIGINADNNQGRWTVPKIPNPAYKGVWAPSKIANPAFFEDSSPSDFTKIAGIGIELWTMTEDILCELSCFQPRMSDTQLMETVDNILIGHDAAEAKSLAKETYHVKKAIEKEAEGSVDADEDVQATTLLDKARLRVYEFIRESSFAVFGLYMIIGNWLYLLLLTTPRPLRLRHHASHQTNARRCRRPRRNRIHPPRNASRPLWPHGFQTCFTH